MINIFPKFRYVSFPSKKFFCATFRGQFCRRVRIYFRVDFYAKWELNRAESNKTSLGLVQGA